MSSYPVSPSILRNLLLLSPLSLVETARRFGVSRSNFMGALAENQPRTLSEERYLKLVEWAGFTVGSGGIPNFAPGVQFRKIASQAQMDALMALLAALQATGPFPELDLVLEKPIRVSTFVYLLAKVRDGVWIFWSIRKDFFPLLRERFPDFATPKKIAFLTKPVPEILASLQQGLTLPAEQRDTYFHREENEALVWSEDLANWLAWARKTLGMNTSAVEAQPLPVSPHTEAELAADRVKARQMACTRAWEWLSHRLDVAGAQHPDVIECPLFSLEKSGDFPIGLVRLDRSWLGDALLALGKEGRLRFYQNEDRSQGYLIEVTEGSTRCGKPMPWTRFEAGVEYLVYDTEQVVRSDTPEHYTCLGPIRAVWSVSRPRDTVEDPSASFMPW